MKNNLLNKPIIILLFISFACSISGKAQSFFTFDKYWQVGFNIGTDEFSGDLTNSRNNFFHTTPFNKLYYEDRCLLANIHVTKQIHTYFGGRFDINYTTLGSHSSQFDAYFKSHMYSYSLMGTLNISSLLKMNESNHYFYIGVGLGFVNFDCLTYSSLTDEIIGGTGHTKKGNSGYHMTTTEGFIPLCVGWSYRFSDLMSFSLEYGIHGINTDILDGFEDGYKSVEGLTYLSVGLNFDFETAPIKKIGSAGNHRKTTPIMREWHKRKRVVMQTPQHKKALKKKKRYNKKHKF